MKVWQLEDAKAKLSEFVTEAMIEPQIISRQGVQEVVAMDIKTYKELIFAKTTDKTTDKIPKKEGEKTDVVSFFRNNAVNNVHLDVGRDRSSGRDV